MKRQSRVVWSKGLFLTPQLFEAQERFLEGEVQFRSLLTGFERWGVDELNIDETALLNRKFRLTGCSGILDTGLAFSMPATDPLPEQREFDSRSDGGQCSHSTYAARQVGQERGTVMHAVPPGSPTAGWAKGSCRRPVYRRRSRCAEAP